MVECDNLKDYVESLCMNMNAVSSLLVGHSASSLPPTFGRSEWAVHDCE